ncbi:hypothetical protein B0H11DRAFT_2283788 [Mycena galericulata]|nr:hypothetical protein B0H11DRAFT_2283788 [Mycena galericulata]
MRIIVPIPSIAATAQPLLPTTNCFQFAVGNTKKQHKRKASIELVSEQGKRTNKLVEAATPGYHLPATYIECMVQEPSFLTAEFTTANDANAFVGGCAGGKSSMALGLCLIKATNAAVPSSSSSNAIAFLTGN